MPTPIVRLRDVDLTLTSRAGPVDILRSVSLDIPAGQSVAIVGPSGSGKTSLLMVMAGLERATRGRSRSPATISPRMGEDRLALARGADIGIVFQSFHLVPTMTALENVALPLEFAGRRDAFDVAARLLGEVGLGHRIDAFPGPAVRRRAAARGARPRAAAPSRSCCSPTSRPAISTAPRAGR